MGKLLALLLASLCCLPAYADGANFDLSGPRLQIKVTRGNQQLPIAQVPNLAPGDRLWVHVDFPASQSEHYLLVACFLRGTTNPPPDKWFTHADIWNKHITQEGVTLLVPDGAQQAVLFLAPSTGGDFSTLRNAVQGRPGAFIRAVQDLNAAAYDRVRYEKFVAAIEKIPSSDTKQLKERSDLLARSLNIKINQDCFLRSSGQQIICLTAGENAVVMDDGHTSLVTQLTSGPATDLVANASATQMMGGGYYSAYVGAIVDVVRIMSGIHSAKYQYIPALGLPDNEDLNLKLNNPPSFHNPKSVLVIGLPAVQSAQMPPLRAVDAKRVLCLRNPDLVLPVEGAPLIFSTAFAHNLVLEISGDHPVRLPLVADALRGGFILDLAAAKDLTSTTDVTGTVKGMWGFDAYTGPAFLLQPLPASQWTVDSADATRLVVGREDHIQLSSTGAACVDTIQVHTADGTLLLATWKPGSTDKPNLLQVNMKLKDVQPGELALQVKQFGQDKPDSVKVNAYADPPTPQKLTFYAGDSTATLSGKGLEQVAEVEIAGAHFAPGDITATGDTETITLTPLKDQAALAMKHGVPQKAHITLKDGRTLDFSFTVQPPRPHITLVKKSVQPAASAHGSSIEFASADDLPLNAKLTFFVKSDGPNGFERSEKIEVATHDNSLHTTLSLDDGSLVLEDRQTVLATLDPAKAFGASAFGDLRFRAVTASGISSDWQPLAHLIRMPELTDVRCPAKAAAPCTLTGSSLYLIDSISADPAFLAATAANIPADLTANSVQVPRPSGTLLYLKLRDNPTSIDTIALPVLPQ
ncbi:MAG: hypothetical protein P4L10_02440 [Acidobacteriaceae bacterium]|nr:hypothetical protein [Acidobacteriaceae bacterium]